MARQKHIIKKQVIDMELHTAASDGRHAQQTVSELYRSRVIAALDKAFDRLAAPGESITIDRLEIDLGEVLFDRLADDFAQKVEERFYSILHEKIESARYRQQKEAGGRPVFSGDSTKVSISPMPESKARWLVHFLHTGQLPWNAGLATGRKRFQQLVRELLAEDRQTAGRLLKGELGKALQQRRFIYQCSDEVIHETLAACMDADRRRNSARQAAEQLNMLLPELIRVCIRRQVFDHVGKTALRHALWSHLFKMAMSATGSVSSKERLLKSNLQSMIRKLIDMNRGSNRPHTDMAGLLDRLTVAVSEMKKDGAHQGLRNSVKQVMDQMRGRGGPGTGGSQHAGPGRLPATDSDSGAEQKPQPVHGTGTGPGKDQTTGRHPDREQGSSGSRDHRSEKKKTEEAGGMNRGTGKGKARDYAEGAAESSGVGQKTADGTGSEESRRGDRPMPAVDEAYIRNAGMVLLHPFIPALFEGLGLTHDKQFTDEHAQQRAVHLLQFLATRQQETPEEELFLNKLICGLAPETPVLPGIVLTDGEDQECENLLKHVVSEWKALKNTSPDSVRHTFLQREGVVAREGFSSGWKVTIERQSFDVLLDRLPWGLSIVKMPWNESIIHVEW